MVVPLPQSKNDIPFKIDNLSVPTILISEQSTFL